MTENQLSQPGNDVNAIATRLRMNEERYSELRKKVVLLEQNMLSSQKKFFGELKLVLSDITDLKRGTALMQDRMLSLLKELNLLARKEDVDVLKKYLDYWEPVKFVTAEHVERIIEEKLEEQSNKNQK
ncbi:MAG: hypothetical protein Q7K43_03285 [Candidatus Woesearchaeota archaeon]|nr:hypothetical protein [Candidatus Woesearchaeota archaeon]